jgi:hypothetical protein
VQQGNRLVCGVAGRGSHEACAQSLRNTHHTCNEFWQPQLVKRSVATKRNKHRAQNLYNQCRQPSTKTMARNSNPAFLLGHPL